ncbi:MAG TPA: hypothetical protein VFA82_06335 [Gaiellaceae bacterium]|nr:hypothetical protein [Gaiellaceae bacterium]
MLALLLLVLLALFGGVYSASSGSTGRPPTTTPMSAPPAPFTVDGKAAAVRAGAVTLRRGEVVRFERPVRVLVVNRLECPRDLHRIALRHSTWRVPDLPSGFYALSPANGPGQLVRVRSHSAPCP